MSRFKSLLLSASLLAGLLGFAGAAFAEAPNADIRNGMQTPPPTDQRIALVIGNSNYQTAPRLANPGNDAQSMSQLLNSAGFEVTQATDLTRKDMVRVVQDFYRQGRRARPRHRRHGLLCRSRRAGRGRELSASGRCKNLVAVRSRRQFAATGRPDGHAGTRFQAGCASSCSTPAATIRSRRSTTPDGAWPSSMRRTARSSAIRPHRAWKRRTATATTARIRPRS